VIKIFIGTTETPDSLSEKTNLSEIMRIAGYAASSFNIHDRQKYGYRCIPSFSTISSDYVTITPEFPAHILPYISRTAA
jgi:hypothetical protein